MNRYKTMGVNDVVMEVLAGDTLEEEIGKY
jgi:hypothetical protein